MRSWTCDFWEPPVVVMEAGKIDPTLEIQRLREELAACHQAMAEQQRQMTVLEFATQALTYSLDPGHVVQTATGLAATLASPPGTSARRGVYYEISGDTMRLIADSDDSGASPTRGRPQTAALPGMTGIDPEGDISTQVAIQFIKQSS